MKNFKKLFSLAFVFLICLSFSSLAFADSKAYEIEDLDLSIMLPDGTYVFNSETSDTDPTWKEAGIPSSVECKTLYNDISCHTHFSYDNNNINVYLSKKVSETTESYYSFADMSEDSLNDLLESYNQEDDTASSTATIYEHSQIPFIHLNIHATMFDGTEIYEEAIFTIVNGYTISLGQNSKEPLTAQASEYLKTLVDGITFGTINPTPEMDKTELFKAILALALITILIISVIVFFVCNSVKAKKHKTAAKELANKLSNYRKQKDLGKTVQGELIFENTTEFTNEAIKTYSIYQSYLKRPVSAVLPSIISLGAFIASIAFGEVEWWISVLMFAAAGFCIFKLATYSSHLDKSLKRVYGKLKSKIATYKFYENEFMIAGLQHTQTHPYFQISEVREHKNYFYLYFGEENCFYINKSNFSKGEAEKFMEFVTTKIKK